MRWENGTHVGHFAILPEHLLLAPEGSYQISTVYSQPQMGITVTPRSDLGL